MNFNAAGFPVDLILFGMIAAFLILRLRSVLGRRSDSDPQPPPSVQLRRGLGFGRRPSGPTLEGRAEPPVAAPGQAGGPSGQGQPAGAGPSGTQARPLPAAGSPVATRLAGFREVERGFDPAQFLRGAETAFRRIVEAFASGDRVVLRSLLTEPTYQAFEQAITAREAAGQTQRSEIRSIQQATIEEAQLVPTGNGASRRGQIEVRFVSDQVSLLVGQDGQPVTGNDAVTELADRWVFERLYPGEASWRLAEARSA